MILMDIANRSYCGVRFRCYTPPVGRLQALSGVTSGSSPSRAATDFKQASRKIRYEPLIVIYVQKWLSM